MSNLKQEFKELFDIIVKPVVKPIVKPVVTAIKWIFNPDVKTSVRKWFKANVKFTLQGTHNLSLTVLSLTLFFYGDLLMDEHADPNSGYVAVFASAFWLYGMTLLTAAYRLLMDEWHEAGEIALGGAFVGAALVGIGKAIGGGIGDSLRSAGRAGLILALIVFAFAVYYVAFVLFIRYLLFLFRTILDVCLYLIRRIAKILK